MGTRAEQLQDLAGSPAIAISPLMTQASANTAAPTPPPGTDPAAPPASGKTAGKGGVTQPPGQPPGEIGGPAGPEPTRYGDWEQKGRCSDF